MLLHPLQIEFVEESVHELRIPKVEAYLIWIQPFEEVLGSAELDLVIWNWVHVDLVMLFMVAIENDEQVFVVVIKLHEASGRIQLGVLVD